MWKTALLKELDEKLGEICRKKMAATEGLDREALEASEVEIFQAIADLELSTTRARDLLLSLS